MSPATTNLQDTARIIRALDEEFERNANTKNAAELTNAYYAEDAQLLPPNSPPVKGRAAIREFREGFLAAGATDVKLETADIGASGDVAYSVGSYRYTQAGVRHVGKYVVVYRRQPGGEHKAIIDSFSDNA